MQLMVILHYAETGDLGTVCELASSMIFIAFTKNTFLYVTSILAGLSGSVVDRSREGSTSCHIFTVSLFNSVPIRVLLGI